MDNVDNPKTFWRACDFGLLGLWKSLGCAGDILGKTAFWRACARILAARRPGWTAASGRQCGTSPPKGRFWPPQKRLSTLSPKALSPKSGEKSPAVTGVLAARPQCFHKVIHRSLRAAGRKRPDPKSPQKRRIGIPCNSITYFAGKRKRYRRQAMASGGAGIQGTPGHLRARRKIMKHFCSFIQCILAGM